MTRSTVPQFTIRPATPADARRIAEIHVRSWQHAYRGIMPDALLDGLSVEQREQFWQTQLADGRRVLVAADAGGEIAGWASYCPCRDADAPGAGEVSAIYLDPACCRRGIGRLLWAAAIGRLADEGFARAAVWVLEANHPARRFYEAMGGRLDAAAVKTFTRDGADLAERRYWFATMTRQVGTRDSRTPCEEAPLRGDTATRASSGLRRRSSDVP